MNQMYYHKVNHFKIVTDRTVLSTKFYAETINRPWMRVKIFVDEGPLARTPEHYKKFFYDWQIKTPTPVHYVPEKGNWKLDEDENVKRIQNRPIPLIYPMEVHKGLWGGEAVIKGYEKRKLKRRRVAMYWTPTLQSTVLYSEILDKYMKMIVTERALELIDDNYGLDNYILNTPINDLYSQLGLRLRKDMIYKIKCKSMYPDDPEKKDELYEKHKRHIIPDDELDWFALSLSEAYRKQCTVEEEEQNFGPYKHIFRKDFIQQLKNTPAVEKSDQEIVVKPGLLGSLGTRLGGFLGKSTETTK